MARCYPLHGYRRLYQSFMRHLDLSRYEARWLAYQLNTANIDTCRLRHPQREYLEMDMASFFKTLEKPAIPYYTVTQLYKSLEALLFNIHNEAIIGEQKDSVKQAECLLRQMESRFLGEYGCEIDDLITSYGRCKWHLNPYEWEEPLNVITMN